MDQSANLPGQELEGHAYHYNLPPQFLDENDGLPLVTKYAHRKAQTMVEIAYSIKVSEDLFVEQVKDEENRSDEEEGQENGTDENANAIVSINLIGMLFKL
jgi:hypothetical protein